MATASPSVREATDAVDDGWNLPTDAFVEILLRLPPIRRRWARLVCRSWCDVIDERTPRGQPPKVLVCFTTATSASATVVDDLEHGWGREVWRAADAAGSGTRRRFFTVVVGTCNGLLCICDDSKPGGEISLANPATGEKLRIPPLPVSHRHAYLSWKVYTFGYTPATGRYKILHLPCRGDPSGVFNALQVFTLGDAAWRDVAVPSASCCADAGLVTSAPAARRTGPRGAPRASCRSTSSASASRSPRRC
ncbi:hypothetical protein PVAP13_6KG336706, partial [Panicum virgatum]